MRRRKLFDARRNFNVSAKRSAHCHIYWPIQHRLWYDRVIFLGLVSWCLDEVRSVKRREEDGDRVFGLRRQLRLRGQKSLRVKFRGESKKRTMVP